MQSGLRRGLHIDDDDEARKPDEYGGKCEHIQDWILTEKEETLRRALMTCFFLEAPLQSEGEPLVRKNNKLTPAKPKTQPNQKPNQRLLPLKIHPKLVQILVAIRSVLILAAISKNSLPSWFQIRLKMSSILLPQSA